MATPAELLNALRKTRVSNNLCATPQDIAQTLDEFQQATENIVTNVYNEITNIINTGGGGATTPVYIIRALVDQVGGVATSLANFGLFAAPLMYRWVQRRSVRQAVRTGFLYCALLFMLGGAFSPLPWVTVGLLLLAAYFLVLLDICGGLPFLMSVKPSQRTEMSAVYSSFRDVSSIISPGLAWLVLQFSPVAGVFVAGGLALLAAWLVAGYLHPELGVPGAKRLRAARLGSDVDRP